MLTRRHFLQNSALVALSPMVPAFLSDMARAAGAQRDARILVVIQMEGGNDGINTVVPFGDDGYGRNRKAIRLNRDDLVKVNDHVGLHPSMRAMGQLIEGGRLAIVQGVGYPNPNRSHFRSMQIWQSSRLEEDQIDRGWIGRAFDQLPWPRPGGPDAIYVGEEELPRTLWGRRTDAAAITSTDDLALRLPVGKSGSGSGAEAEDITSFVRRSVLSAYGTAGDLAGSGTAGATAAAAYPQTKLAVQLQLISQLIKMGGGTRVYYASQSSYDTHGAQLPQQARLLDELSGGLKAFLDDLKAAGLSDRVVVMAFSEFGRRVAENDSQGTDHGTAAPLFVAGDAVKPGLIGKTPSLEDLDDGDLKMSIDFRRVYAALLEQWLKIPAKEVLGGAFDPVQILRNSV